MQLDRDSARQEIRSQWRQILRAKGVKRAKYNANKTESYVCPLCGHGTNGDGLTENPNSKQPHGLKCFGGSCGFAGDIIDLYMQVNSTDYNTELHELAETCGIEIVKDSSAIIHRQAAQTEKQAPAEPEPDYTDFFLSANKHLGETDYHRGISMETLNRFNVGYVADWRKPTKAGDKQPPASPRLIIPTSKYSYLARDTRPDNTLEEWQKIRKKMKIGKLRFFNAAAIWTAQKPVFILEGEIDALSVLDAGGLAVGLGTATKARAFVEMIEQAESKPPQPFIIALDSDKAGQTAAQTLADGFKRNGIAYGTADINGEYKDANEHLQADRKGFIDTVAYIERQAAQMGQEPEPEPETASETEAACVANHIQEFINGIADSVNTPCIPTGFEKLDKALDDGLYPGLHIVGALSSAGKTTFVCQIADNIARQGTDVVVFSLEMARTELMAKSISRHTIERVTQYGGETADAKSARGIMAGKRYGNYSQREKELIKQAVADYSQYSGHLYIYEGMGEIGAREIRQKVEAFIKERNSRPIVVIDYLQILAPWDTKLTEKQNTDKATLELKRMCRDYHLTIIAISSFNRENYSKEATMSAFKESGGIEYNSDVLLALQAVGAGNSNFNEYAERAKEPRHIEVCILKQRNAPVGVKIRFHYYATFNYFKETDEPIMRYGEIGYNDVITEDEPKRRKGGKNKNAGVIEQVSADDDY